MPDNRFASSTTDGSFASKELFGDDYSKLLLEQYKLYVDTSTKVSERRAATQTFFLSANTLLATVYGLTAGKESTLAPFGSWQWAIPLAGLVLALSWFFLIRSYSSLNRAKFQVISEIEKRLPAQLFTLEWDFLEHGASRRHFALTRVERLIPLTFALFFAGLIAHALVQLAATA